MPEYIGPAQAEQDETGAVLPDNVKSLLRQLAKKVSLRDMWPRILEIKNSAEQRYFYQGYQHIYWSQRSLAFQVGQAGASAFWTPDSAKKPRIRREYNIYLAYAKSFMAVFSQHSPATRFQPDDPKDTEDIQAAPEADRMRRVVEKFNDPKILQTEAARLLWTDGRVVAFTDFIKDGERFGYAPDGTPNGRETVELYGVLESQIPLVLRKQHELDYIKLSREYPLSTQKYKYPDKEKQLSQGSKGYSDVEEVARNARIGIAEDLRWLAESELAYIVTEDTYFFRPRVFYEFQEDDRNQLLEYFPSGCRVVFTGQTLCEARDDKFDDHIAILKALPADSQRGISLGRSMVQIQMEFNDWMNMISEAGKYAIPATFVRQPVIDIDAIEEQFSEYGSYYPVEDDTPQLPIAQHFYREEPIELSPVFVTFMENLQGPLPQFITGQMPSVWGGNMEDQKTAKAYAMARDQALGLLSLNWYPFKLWYCTILEQGVRLGAVNRDPSSTMSTVVGQGREQELVEVEIASLTGNTHCTPVTDENFPDTPTAKRNTLLQIMQIGAADPAVGEDLQNPENRELFYEAIGMPDLEINGRDSRNKQLKEIAELLQSPPAPDVDAIDNEIETSLQTTGGMPPIESESMPMVSSVPIDKDFDDHAVELSECKRWINSHEGQQAKVDNPDGFANVRAHALEHQKVLMETMMQQMMMQQAMAPPPAAPPPSPGKGSPPKQAGTPSPPKPQPQQVA